ncbi:MAG: hypothetical protein NT126_03355 [Bacteroidetes bacterium]|nr:hypothetical protein [Bacteroidota bacterium]
MSVESLQMKVENQQNMIKQLSTENEELYHQFNHLMIRNNKLLKRIDDLQGIIDDLHIRIEELQLINGNMLKINDRIKAGKDHVLSGNDSILSSCDAFEKQNDDIKYRDEFKSVFTQWKNYPGQDGKNEPNLRKQAQMLVHIYHHKTLRAADLFNLTGVGGVTGARYVATLKKFGLISYTGARKKGWYEMTKKGIEFVDHSNENPLPVNPISYAGNPAGAVLPSVELQGIPVREDVKELLASQFDHADL